MCRFLTFQIGFVLLVLSGCGGASPAGSTASSLEMAFTQERVGDQDQRGADAASQAASSTEDVVAQSSAASRQIIYSARITVETVDLEQFSSQLHDELPKLNGFVSNLNQYGAAGQQEQANWTLRVPARNFEEMLEWLEKNTTVLNKTIDSQDVTEEYVDVESRIANKRKTEQRLLGLLEDRSAKLEDVLVVERELDRIREDIERMEGRLRYLTDNTALSTIYLVVAARSNYHPLAQVGFKTRVAETWSNSIDNLSSLAGAAVLTLVSFAPWLLILIALNFLTILAWRTVRLLRRKTPVHLQH